MANVRLAAEMQTAEIIISTKWRTEIPAGRAGEYVSTSADIEGGNETSAALNRPQNTSDNPSRRIPANISNSSSEMLWRKSFSGRVVSMRRSVDHAPLPPDTAVAPGGVTEISAVGGSEASALACCATVSREIGGSGGTGDSTGTVAPLSHGRIDLCGREKRI